MTSLGTSSSTQTQTSSHLGLRVVSRRSRLALQPQRSQVPARHVGADTSRGRGCLRNENRDVEIRVRLLGAWHDGHIAHTYAKVQAYLFDIPRKREYPMRPGKGHEEWMIDEVRLSDLDYAVH
jgi:hypothetical protein